MPETRPAIRSAAEMAQLKASTPQGTRNPPRRNHYKVGNCLAALREKSGLSLSDVEKGCGVNSQTVQSAEDGGDISISRALRLAAFYGMGVNDIWDGTEELRKTTGGVAGELAAP